MLKGISNLSKDGGVMEIFIPVIPTGADKIENDLGKYLAKIEEHKGSKLIVLVDRYKLVHSGPQEMACVHLISFCDPIGSRTPTLYRQNWEEGIWLLVNTILANCKAPMGVVVKKPSGEIVSVAYEAPPAKPKPKH